MQTIDILPLIQKKEAGQAFTRDETDRIAVSAARGLVSEDQIAAFLKAVYQSGMTPEETRDLTLSMAYSGKVADLSAVGAVCVDKHSTGGVGDTTTLVLTPLCAACGAKVAKMSGKGLGHTGGTLDKLQSIPGFSVSMPMERFIRQVRTIGCAVVGQTDEIAPADKVFYDLRNATGTVDSMPLIVSSIMSKKIAAGSHAIVLDVKTGNGALMKTLEKSIELARSMVEIGELSGKRTMALVTGMEQPLGMYIGNALEVEEAIDILSNRAGGRLLDLSLQLGAMMLVASAMAKTEQEAREKLQHALASGKGLLKLSQMIEAQGGNPDVTRDTRLLPKAERILPIHAARDGYVCQMDTTALGEASRMLGAGRAAVDDVIDPAVGIVMAVSIGDFVRKGQPLAFLHVNDPKNQREAFDAVSAALSLSDEKTAAPPIVYAKVGADGVSRLV